MKEYKTIQELYEEKDSWCKDVVARDRTGQETHPSSETARQWCLLGALNKVYPHMYARIAKKRKIIEHLGNTDYIKFSDENGHKAVLELVTELGI